MDCLETRTPAANPTANVPHSSFRRKGIAKRYASMFTGADLHKMLAALGVDTLIVTGISTSHCLYAGCRGAVSLADLVGGG
jgi:nicotinamidase-related amidase